MRALLLTLLCQLLVVFPASAEGFLDDPAPPPGEVFIDMVAVNGSGCPPGTAALALSSDSRSFSVTFSNYLAGVGVGVGPLAFRKNCQLSVAVHVPDGFTYAIASADFRGFASLATGSTAMLRASNYFQGTPVTSMRQYPFTAPFEDNWHIVDQSDLPALVFHPCGALRNLNINTELRVTAGTSDPATTTSFLVMDSVDGGPGATYHFVWKRCPS